MFSAFQILIRAPSPRPHVLPFPRCQETPGAGQGTPADGGCGLRNLGGAGNPGRGAPVSRRLLSGLSGVQAARLAVLRGEGVRTSGAARRWGRGDAGGRSVVRGPVPVHAPVTGCSHVQHTGRIRALQ